MNHADLKQDLSIYNFFDPLLYLSGFSHIISHIPGKLFESNLFVFVFIFLLSGRTPPLLNETCRYGDLFRGAGSPIEALYAGVGTNDDEGINDTVVTFRKVKNMYRVYIRLCL